MTSDLASPMLATCDRSLAEGARGHHVCARLGVCRSVFLCASGISLESGLGSQFRSYISSMTLTFSISACELARMRGDGRD